MTEVAEAYFHLRRLDLTNEQVRQVGDLASILAAQTAATIFPPDTIIDVSLEEGSLKGWIKVIGVLGITYGVLADYKGFKESIREIIDDGRTFSEAVTEKLLSSAQELKGAYVYRRERRTKTPGKIKRVIQKREWLEEHRRQLSVTDIQRESYEIERLLQQILADIEPEHRTTVRNLLGEDKPSPAPSAHARALPPPGRSEQSGLFVGGEVVDERFHADYHRRFLLSDELFGLSPRNGTPLPRGVDRNKD